MKNEEKGWKNLFLCNFLKDVRDVMVTRVELPLGFIVI